MNNLKIISGGQSGITKGALDAALAMNITCGGWYAQKSHVDTADAEKYPLVVLENSDDREGVRKNVLDSDASAIIFFKVLEGCAEETLDDCVQQGKPYRLIDADELQPGQAAKLLSEFLRESGVNCLNVIGPESNDSPKDYKYGQDTTRLLIESLRRGKQGGGKRGNSKRGRQSDASKMNSASRSSHGKPGSSSRKRSRKKSRSRQGDAANASSNHVNRGSASGNSGGVEVIVEHRVPKVNLAKREES